MARKFIFKGDYEFTGKAAQTQRGSLEYAKKDNKAWFAPDGNQTARNWRRAMYVTRTKSGRLSYQFHDKCVTANTPNTRANQAAFGANAAVVRGLLADDAIYNTLMIIYVSYKEQYKTLNTWLASRIRPALFSKSRVITFYDSSHTLNVANPWQYAQGVSSVEVPDEILRKFAPHLAAIIISVDGVNIAAYNNNAATWGDFVASPFNDGSFVDTRTPQQVVAPINYLNKVLFTANGEIVTNLTPITANSVTTIAPN